MPDTDGSLAFDASWTFAPDTFTPARADTRRVR